MSERDGRENERLREQLRVIAEADEIDLMLDPLWAKRMARAALNGEDD